MELRDFFEEEVRRAPDDYGAMVDAFGRHFDRAAQVAAVRRELGWTQQELADKSGLDQSEISRIERGRGNPTEATWSRVADAMGMVWASRLMPKRESTLA